MLTSSQIWPGRASRSFWCPPSTFWVFPFFFTHTRYPWPIHRITHFSSIPRFLYLPMVLENKIRAPGYHLGVFCGSGLQSTLSKNLARSEGNRSERGGGWARVYSFRERSVQLLGASECTVSPALEVRDLAFMTPWALALCRSQEMGHWAGKLPSATPTPHLCP